MTVKASYSVLREMIFKSPLALTSLNDERLIRIANSYLPYDTGIEIECAWLKTDFEYHFQQPECVIKDLISHQHDGSEKRFRIPPGIKGMICLYRITEWLKEHCGLNERSGIHYHIDMGNTFYHYQYIKNEDHEWMLKSLDKWGYKGHYNSRRVSDTKKGWIAIRTGKNSLEFRIGEMTFDYELLIKRILNCQNIVRKIKKKYPVKTLDQIMSESRTKRHQRHKYSPW